MSSCSSSAEEVADIEGLLQQILTSVPALSLLRFKSVSKHWLSLISDPDFRRRHSLTYPNPKIASFFSPKTKEDAFKSIPLRTPSANPFKTLNTSNSRILQSCNGLFLLAGDSKLEIYIVNPTTNEFRRLSAPSLENLSDDSRMFVRYGLGFDPRKSPHYRVVCVSHRRLCSSRQRIEVYSSETGTWGRSFKAPFFVVSDYDDGVDEYFVVSCREGAVYCNGAAHWIRKTRVVGLSCMLEREEEREGYDRRDWDLVHYFDFGEESLRIAGGYPPVPQAAEDLYLEDEEEGKDHGNAEFRQRYFGECGGCLCLVEVLEHCQTQIEVMEMKRDYSGWSVKYCVDISAVVAPLSGQVPSAFVVLFVEKDDDDASAHLWLHMPGKVVSYNLSTLSFRTSVELDNEELFLALDDNEEENYPCMESLACI